MGFLELFEDFSRFPCSLNSRMFFWQEAATKHPGSTKEADTSSGRKRNRSIGAWLETVEICGCSRATMTLQEFLGKTLR